MRYYLSGPMTGIDEYNFPAFHAVHKALIENRMNANPGEEIIILNPAHNFGGRTDLYRTDYMREDVKLLTHADVIVLLPGWENSAGAKLEAQIASEIGCEFMLAILYQECQTDMGLAQDWQFEWLSWPSPHILEPEPAASPREAVLQEAIELITGDRNNTYGPPTQDFKRTADILNAMGYRGAQGRMLVAHDTALLVMAVKMSRLVWSPEKRDHWADMAGYSGCGWECVTEENKDTLEDIEQYKRWLGAE